MTRNVVELNIRYIILTFNKIILKQTAIFSIRKNNNRAHYIILKK